MTKPRAQTWCQWVILILALFLRWPLAEPHWYHGDEWAFTVHPLGFWSGDLNPHFFNYPTLQFYFNSIVYYLYYLLFGDEAIDSFIAYRYFVQDADLIAIARGISTLAAVATVAVAMRIGTTLYGTKNGLFCLRHIRIYANCSTLFLALLDGRRVDRDPPPAVSARPRSAASVH